jgi:hypothetical protein
MLALWVPSGHIRKECPPVSDEEEDLRSEDDWYRTRQGKMRRDETGRDGTERDGTGRDGTERDETRRGRQGWQCEWGKRPRLAKDRA